MFFQKKRRINHKLFELLSMGITQRDAARFFNVDRKTIARRLVFFGEQARSTNNDIIERYQQRAKDVGMLVSAEPDRVVATRAGILGGYVSHFATCSETAKRLLAVAH